MPRIRQNMSVYVVNDFKEEVRVRLARLDMKQGDLAEDSGIPRSTLSKRLNDPDSITVSQLRGIVSAIKPDAGIVLKLLGYTTQDIKKIKEGTA